MKIVINKGSIAYLCIVWAFALLLGVAVGLNWPFVLLVVATILTLFTFTDE
jgi:hypothetical protein